MQCPKCFRERGRIRKTVQKEQITVRYYECRNIECRERWKTDEQVMLHLRPPRRV